MFNRLDVLEVRSDRRRLHMDVAHTEARPSSYDAEMPMQMYLRVDGCPIEPPPIHGMVHRSSKAPPSTVTIELADLPDGELDLSLRAFESARTVSLLKRGVSVTELRDEDHFHWVHVCGRRRRLRRRLGRDRTSVFGASAAERLVQPAVSTNARHGAPIIESGSAARISEWRTLTGAPSHLRGLNIRNDPLGWLRTLVASIQRVITQRVIGDPPARANPSTVQLRNRQGRSHCFATKVGLMCTRLPGTLALPGLPAAFIPPDPLGT
jgi:hypothetical protein